MSKDRWRLGEGGKKGVLESRTWHNMSRGRKGDATDLKLLYTGGVQSSYTCSFRLARGNRSRLQRELANSSIIFRAIIGTPSLSL